MLVCDHLFLTIDPVSQLTDQQLTAALGRLATSNRTELLAAAAWKGKDAVEEMLMNRRPRPDVPASVRKVPVPRRPEEATVLPPLATPAVAEASEPSTPPGRPAPEMGSAHASSTTGSRGRVRPLGAERYEVRVTASAVLREKLRVAQDLLAHAVPSGDLSAVFERALDLLIAERKRQKYGATSRPRANVGTAPGSRHIPAAVRRVVDDRDGGRCAFVSKDGRRCRETRLLEFHHVVPYATGVEVTPRTIALRCRAHNGHEVDLAFGPGWRFGVSRPGTTRESRPRPG